MNVQNINNTQNFNGKLFIEGLKSTDIYNKERFASEIKEVRKALEPAPYDMYVQKNQWGEYNFKIVKDNESASLNNITYGQTKELSTFLKNLTDFIKLTNK